MKNKKLSYGSSAKNANTNLQFSSIDDEFALNTELNHVKNQPIINEASSILVDSQQSTVKQISEVLEKNTDASISTELKNLNSQLIEECNELFNVEKEYYEQINHYREIGWIMTRDGKEGIEDKEGNFYMLPTLMQVYEALSEKMELLKYKASQGFTKLLIVPFALSFEKMFNDIGMILIKDKYNGNVTIIPEEKAGLEKSCRYNPLVKADAPNDIIWQRKKSKKDLLQSAKIPGWSIQVLEQDVSISKINRKEEVTGGREPLSKYRNFQDFISILSGNKLPYGDTYGAINVKPITIYQGKEHYIYEGENGVTPETWLSLTLQELKQRNKIPQDNYYTDAVYLLGSYISYPGMGQIPFIDLGDTRDKGFSLGWYKLEEYELEYRTIIPTSVAVI